MRRREFCKLGAATGALAAMPGIARADSSVVAPGFGFLSEDYAQYCATPADRRTFYTLRDGRIVQERLNNAQWKPTDWGTPPVLPVPGGSWDGVPMSAPVSGLAGTGPYQPTWESLLAYEAPEWYRDAKFGIWAHWSPQCVPEDGDWYGRNMYMQGSDQYRNQVAQYGPPSTFGYKDLCAQWTLLNWQPDALITRFKKAGARLFLALANHHDGFDTWNSQHQPWNAVHQGPHSDVVGAWAKAARAQGLRFGVTVHQARNWWWFQTSHGADATGPLAGVPYDGDLVTSEGEHQWWQGLDPQRLYGVKHPFDALPDASYVKNFYDRTRDLIDQHDPDLLYFDNSLFPLGWGGMNLGAYFYNHNLQTHGGRMEAVANIKEVPARLAKAVVADYERGLTSGIMPFPFQSETCIGQWHYQRSLYETPGEFGGYLPPRDVIHWLIDTVSKNGTFILNIPGKPDGTIDSKEIAVLDGITLWMGANAEAIYATRPWKIYGEGADAIKSGSFQGDSIRNLSARDVRFTRSKDGSVVYAFLLGIPQGNFTIDALGAEAATQPGKIEHITILDTNQTLKWKQTAKALEVTMPSMYKPSTDFAMVLKVHLRA